MPNRFDGIGVPPHGAVDAAQNNAEIFARRLAKTVETAAIVFRTQMSALAKAGGQENDLQFTILPSSVCTPGFTCICIPQLFCVGQALWGRGANCCDHRAVGSNGASEELGRL